MNVDYYTLLGIPREATDAEIKAAFRRARSSAHPDRNGGSDELMKQVNRAHDCLTDPERRAIYDATGVDQPSGDQVKELEETLLDQRATQSLEELFNALLGSKDGWDLLQAARSAVANKIADHHNDISEGKQRVRVLTKKLGRVRRKKAGNNLVDQLLQKGIDKATRSIEDAELDLRITTRVQVLLQDYDADQPPAPPPAATQVHRPRYYGMDGADAFAFMTGGFR